MLELKIWTEVQKQMLFDGTLQNDLMNLCKTYDDFFNRFGVHYAVPKKLMYLSADPLNQFLETNRIMEIENALMIRMGIGKSSTLRRVVKVLEKYELTKDTEHWYIARKKIEHKQETEN